MPVTLATPPTVAECPRSTPDEVLVCPVPATVALTSTVTWAPIFASPTPVSEPPGVVNVLLIGALITDPTLAYAAPPNVTSFPAVSGSGALRQQIQLPRHSASLTPGTPPAPAAPLSPTWAPTVALTGLAFGSPESDPPTPVRTATVPPPPATVLGLPPAVRVVLAAPCPLASLSHCPLLAISAFWATAY